MKEVSLKVSLRLGHATALPATGGHSLPCRHFATFQELSTNGFTLLSKVALVNSTALWYHILIKTRRVVYDYHHR